jgi:hypothetical protein
MSYTIKVVRTRPNLSVPFTDPNDVGENTPAERHELSSDGLTTTTYFKYDEVPPSAYDRNLISNYEKQYDAYLKANNITRHIAVINDATNEVVVSYYTWQ